MMWESRNSPRVGAGRDGTECAMPTAVPTAGGAARCSRGTTGVADCPSRGQHCPPHGPAAHSGHRDHPFRAMAITRSGASRSPSPVMPITGSERSDAGARRCSSSPPSSVPLLRPGHGTPSPAGVSSPARVAPPAGHRPRGAWGRSRPPRARRIAWSGAPRGAARCGAARVEGRRARGRARGAPRAPPPRVVGSGPVGAKRRARPPRSRADAVDGRRGLPVRGHASFSWPADFGFRRDGPFSSMRCAAWTSRSRIASATVGSPR